MGRQPIYATCGKDAANIPPLLSAGEWDMVVESLRLSPRKASIVSLLMQGKRDKQIAAKLGMNVWTVRTHLTHMFARLDVTDRVELILYVFKTARDGNRKGRHPRN